MPAGRSLGANPQRNLVETRNRLSKLAEICDTFFATSNFRDFFDKAEPLEGEVVHRFVQDLAKTLNRPEVPSKKQGANEPDFIDLRKDLPAPRWTEGLEHVAWVANADQLFPCAAPPVPEERPAAPSGKSRASGAADFVGQGASSSKRTKKVAARAEPGEGSADQGQALSGKGFIGFCRKCCFTDPEVRPEAVVERFVAPPLAFAAYRTKQVLREALDRACVYPNGSLVDGVTKASLEQYLVEDRGQLPPAFYPSAKPQGLWPVEVEGAPPTPAEKRAQQVALITAFQPYSQKALGIALDCVKQLEDRGKELTELAAAQVFLLSPAERELHWLAKLVAIKNILSFLLSVTAHSARTTRLLTAATVTADPERLQLLHEQASRSNASAQLFSRGALSHLFWSLQAGGLLDLPCPPLWDRPCVLWPDGNVPRLEWGEGSFLEASVPAAWPSASREDVAAATAGWNVESGDGGRGGAGGRKRRRR